LNKSHATRRRTVQTIVSMMMQETAGEKVKIVNQVSV
jgi:hypothetical protein